MIHTNPNSKYKLQKTYIVYTISNINNFEHFFQKKTGKTYKHVLSYIILY